MRGAATEFRPVRAALQRAHLTGVLEKKMTVILYADCDGTTVAFLHESVDDAILAAERGVGDRCKSVGIEVIPPDEAWADSYIVEADTREWRRLSAEVQAGHVAPSNRTEAAGAGMAEQAYDLYVRTPSGVWARVGYDRHGVEPADALADLVAAVGPYRAKLGHAEDGARTPKDG
jgi:hypothetical protein